ncbi:MAG TPA: ABC transporter permease [Thermoleophilaceae bacterium]
MTVTLRDSWYMTVRHLRALWRQPAWIAVTLVQPIIWLLLYGALFKRVVQIPGFQSGSYIEFLVPGVLVMTAFFGAGWGGMPVIDDLNRGVIDRFLTTPVHKVALVAGRIVQGAIGVIVQSLIIVVLALITGAHFRNGVGGVALMIFLAVLLAAATTAWSYGVALYVRKEETLIALMQFLLLPLTFLSGAFMQLSLVPNWISNIAGFNPLNWAVEAGRSAALQHTDWGYVASRTGFLLALLAVAVWFAVRAFASYQRSI